MLLLIYQKQIELQDNLREGKNPIKISKNWIIRGHMKLNKEILKKKELTLPFFYTNGTCENAFYTKLIEFHDCVKEYEDVDFVWLDNLAQFEKYIKKMFEEYYLGHQGKAYSAFRDALRCALNETPVIKTAIPDEPLYRARVNTGVEDYKNNEMFHIKYDERSKVSTQRFSFPGLPCLYLGGSSYVCWLELNRPQFDQFQVASFKQVNAEDERLVLDLSIHPVTFYNELLRKEDGKETEHEYLTLEEYLKLWPIIAACSIAVKNEKNPFKPEYIFPQFMLQAILEKEKPIFEDVCGIRYMSIKAGKICMRQYESDYRTYTNYVFPIQSKESNSEGHCKFLSSLFQIERNYSGKELQIISDMIREGNIKWVRTDEMITKEMLSTLDEAEFYGSNGKAYPYGKSIFRRIEKILAGVGDVGANVFITDVRNSDIDKMYS